MTERTNNAITEDIVHIRDTYELSRSDRDALADAANRIQAQGRALTHNAQTCDDWFETEYPAHDVYDHEHQSAYERWQKEIKGGFMAGLKAAPALPADIHDATTHRDSWLAAFDKLIGHESPDDQTYWQHERAALVRLLDQITNHEGVTK